MKQNKSKKVYIYPITDIDGTPLDLMNVLVYIPRNNDKGETDLVLDRVDSFIGRHDHFEYIRVGGTENLSKPGVIFRYASYVQKQDGLLSYYLQCYHNNLPNCR